MVVIRHVLETTRTITPYQPCNLICNNSFYNAPTTCRQLNGSSVARKRSLHLEQPRAVNQGVGHSLAVLAVVVQTPQQSLIPLVHVVK